MNSAQNISDLNPLELSGILVCDALMLRDGIVASNGSHQDSSLSSIEKQNQKDKRIRKANLRREAGNSDANAGRNSDG